MGLPKAAKGGSSRKVKASISKKTVVPEFLLQRGLCDRAVVRRATQMTREEWLTHQKGMDKKWPLPDYMNGEKGHTCFKDETYSIVTCWTAETRIQYRPHAKAPGSKSHLRYEKYSKARTVGEALELSSYPADWCWDYERGFIKVLGGFVRDEPLDCSDVARAEEGQITEVDKAIHTWYKREMARKLGVKVSELSESQGWGESLAMRGQRLLAQKEAKERLEAADREGRRISDEEVLLTLKRWAFFRNPWRQNVMREGQEWVFSDTLGLLRDRQGDIHLTAPTRRYPQVAELIARWLTDRLPKEAEGFKFTSMNLNCNYAAAMHRDNGNFGPSFIRAFGAFSGGELNYWPEDAGGKLEKLPKAQKVQFDLQKGLVLFNGNCAHSVEDFTGSRYSVVYFTVGCHADIGPEDKAKIVQLGIPYPSPDEDPYALLRAPRGYKAAAAGAAAPRRRPGEPPAFRLWPVESLERPLPRRSPADVRKAAQSTAKRRLAPENARSFYRNDQRRQRQRQEAADAR